MLSHEFLSLPLRLVITLILLNANSLVGYMGDDDVETRGAINESVFFKIICIKMASMIQGENPRFVKALYNHLRVRLSLVLFGKKTCANTPCRTQL